MLKLPAPDRPMPRTLGGTVSALTLNDVRAREEIIALGRSGSPIGVVNSALALHHKTDLRPADLMDVVRSEIRIMEACGELFDIGHHSYTLHPALFDSSEPLAS
jgi:hypothetical protein